MRYGSTFSGTGGELGLERAGMTAAWQVESDPYRREVLARHWPDVERHDDVRTVCGRSESSDKQSQPEQSTTRRSLASVGEGRATLGSVDLICGGPPCQDLSVAGLRAGLSGSRSGLFWEFARIVGEVLPRWFLMEQVPGLLSANSGRDFGLVIGAFSDLGYGVAWRILDSQFFGVPQRRRRLYFVGHSSGRCDYPAAVLFEPEGGGGDTQASGETGEGVAYALSASARGTGDGHGNAWNSTYITNPLGAKDASGYRLDLDHETYVPEVVGAIDGTFGHHGLAHSAQSAVAGHYVAEVGRPLHKSGGIKPPDTDTYIVSPLKERDSKGLGRDGGDDKIALQSQTVRRLTPVECERLQGFPDDWTHGKDGPRYAALGDAWTVPVIQWIGERIMMVESATIPADSCRPS